MAESLRKAINENCKECIYDSHERGAWREQVTACPVVACKLWHVRPRSMARKPQKQAGVA